MEPAPSRAIAGFADWAATYDTTIAHEVEQYSGMPYAEVLRRVCEAAAPAPGAQVLDIGTGTGTLALGVARQLETGHVVGIDPTAQMLARAEENARKTGLAGRVEFRCAPAEALPFPDASFDAVVSSIALHHTQVRQSLREIARVLKPGGRLVAADMGRNRKWETSLGALVLPAMAVYYLATKRSVKMMRAEMAAFRQLFLKEEWEALLPEAGLCAPQVQEFRHPKSEWYSSILIIQAGKEFLGAC